MDQGLPSGNKVYPGMIWLEEYHINRYVRPYDARTEGRYLNPPKIRSEFNVGDYVVIIPQGRFRFGVGKSFIGRHAYISEFSETNPHRISGRHAKLRFLDGRTPDFSTREINLKLLRKA